MWKKLVISFLLLALFISCNKKNKEQLIIGAASSMIESLEEIKKSYEISHPNIELIFTYASSGTLQMQIENGAAFDIFISADPKKIDFLINKGYILASNVSPLLENELILVTNIKNEINNFSFNDLAYKNYDYLVGIGDINSVPLGEYSNKLLKNINSSFSYKDNFSFATDAKQVLTWIHGNQIDLALIYSSDILHTSNLRILDRSDIKITYSMGLISTTSSAQDFFNYLTEDEAQNILITHGFKKVGYND